MPEATNSERPVSMLNDRKEKVAASCREALTLLGLPQFGEASRAGDALTLTIAHEIVEPLYQRVMAGAFNVPAEDLIGKKPKDAVAQSQFIDAALGALQAFEDPAVKGASNEVSKPQLNIHDVLAVGSVVANPPMEDGILNKAKAFVSSSPAATTLQAKLEALPPFNPPTK